MNNVYEVCLRDINKKEFARFYVKTEKNYEDFLEDYINLAKILKEQLTQEQLKCFFDNATETIKNWVAWDGEKPNAQLLDFDILLSEFGLIWDESLSEHNEDYLIYISKIFEPTLKKPDFYAIQYTSSDYYIVFDAIAKTLEDILRYIEDARKRLADAIIIDCEWGFIE